MKVIIVSRGLPDSKNPTNGIFELDQAKALKKMGINVTIMVVDLRSIRRWRHYGIKHTIIEEMDCYIISIPVGNVPNSLFCFIGSLALNALFTYYYASNSKPDIIHSHYARQGYMTVKAVKSDNIPIIITEHSSSMNQQIIKKDMMKIARKAYQGADKLISVSHALSNNIKKQTGYTSIVIPNAVDIDLFCKCLETKIQHDIFTYVSVGRLVRGKKMDLLINAFKEVHVSRPNTRLIILGGGEEEKKLQKMIEDYCLNENIIIKGHVTRTEVALTFREADAFVLLSEEETFGVAYIEALAAGIPVIATRCKGPEDFMRKEFGLMIDVNAIDQAVNAMISIYDHRKMYNDNNISTLTAGIFSPRVISQRLYEVYKEVIQTKAK